MNRMTILRLISVTGITALVCLMAGYETRLNPGLTVFSLPLLLWRLALYAITAFFWLRRVRPHLQQRCPEHRIRRTEYLMVSLAVLSEITALLREL